jgi:LacI family transcriptional regulator
VSTITINEVAERAGVSIKTVSRVLNREPNVREETRERVLMAVEALDYRPSQSARSLAGSRSFLLGLFFDNPSPAYVADVQRGAVSTCRGSGYHLVIEPVDSADPDLVRTVRRAAGALRLDGVLLTPPVVDNPLVLDALDQAGTPYVRIAPHREFERAPWVGMDDARAAYEMTVHLLDLGHVDVAFITGPAEHGAAHRRYDGFLAAMRDRGLAVRPDRVRQGAFSFRSGVDCAEALLGTADRPTAIFAANDDMALGVLAAAGRMGVCVPAELSVAGFDDTPSASAVWPPLTTVRQPIFEMAAAAAGMILSGPDHGRDQAGRPTHRLLDFRLMSRASTAPPRK